MPRDLHSDVPLASREARFTDVEAQHVLARAAERERALGTTVSATQLRDAALEAGISAAAFDDAVAEVRAGPVRRGRWWSGVLAAVIGLVLLVGAAGVALQRGVTSASAGDGGALSAQPSVQTTPIASTCGPPSGVPIERLQSLASGLYPEVLTPSNRHRSLVVALRFDAGCHLKAHALTQRGEEDGIIEVLKARFPVAGESGWQTSGAADVGPWTFEEGKPVVMWGVDRPTR